MKLSLTPHARQRLFERYGLTSLPKKRPVFVSTINNQRRVYKIDEMYLIIRKRDKKVITVSTKYIMKDCSLI